MKIAFYSHLFLPNMGGVEIQIHNLATAQARAGHDVSLVLPWSNWSALGAMRKRLGYRVLPLLPRLSTIALRSVGRTPDRRWLVGMQFRRWQRIFGFDIWHIHGGYPSGVLVASELQRMALPAVLTCHGEDIQTLPEIGYGIRLDPARDRQLVGALRQYDGMIAISQSIATEYAAAGVAAERTFHVPNGIDVSRIKRTSVNREGVRKRLGLSLDKPVLLTVGRNHPKKGYHQIPSIALHLQQAGYDFTWLLVGHGTGQVVEQAVRLGLGDRVRSLQTGVGQTPCLDSLPSEEAIELYKSADLFVFPTLLESFGLVVVEAMAAGLPVVASAAPGVRDIVHHRQTGILTPPGDPEALAQGITLLLDNHELRLQIAEQASRASERYELRRVAGECIDVYRQVRSAKTSAGDLNGLRPICSGQDEHGCQ